jgi:ribosomal protein S18 acetylase RimI-like enzyme
MANRQSPIQKSEIRNTVGGIMPFSIASPAFKEKEEYKWRGITRKDIPEIWGLFQTVNEADNNDYAETMDDMEREFDDPWSQPRLDGRIIRNLKGKLVAIARIFVNPAPTTENVAYLLCEIEPEAREQGLEQECLEWMEERATARLAQAAQAEGADVMPRVLRTGIPETSQSEILLYQENGYKHTRSFFKMERDLHQPIPENPLPPGLALRNYGEDIDQALRLAQNEAFADHWGHEPMTREDWQNFIIQSSAMRRDLTLVVMDREEVVAYSVNGIKTEENERLGIRRGWINLLGTRRKYRKHGIASALLAETMRRFKAEGMDTVGLGVDADSLTNALRLYEKLGFKAVKTRVVLEKQL